MNGQEFTSDKIGAIGAAIVDILAEGNSVAIPGFGTFSPEKADEYVASDASGRRMLMPPAIIVNFKPSVVLRNRLK